MAINNIYPSLSLYQPWATWIMRNWKTIETRTHNRFACLKGKTILIHAAQKTDGSNYAVKNPYLTKEQILLNPDEMLNGFILGKAYIADFKKLESWHSKFALIECEQTTRYGLFLENIIKFDNPIPCKGEIGIWYYDLNLKQKVKKPNNSLLLNL